MKVTSLRVQNFRSFEDSDEVQLDTVNVLIGANNSGKSSILRALHQMQHGLNDLYGDVRVGTPNANIYIKLSEISSVRSWNLPSSPNQATFFCRLLSNDRRDGTLSQSFHWANAQKSGGDFRLPNAEPDHFIVPFFSRRKTGGYAEDIREANVRRISSDMSNLAAKLSRLANPAFPAYQQYSAACEAILGFVVTAIPSPAGQRPGIYLPDMSAVSIEQMGEGVSNIVYLLAQLAVSEGKLFLIEEPENDLHPQALKALLDLIIASAKSNQFVISTHSNIVVSHLCSMPDSRLFKVASKKGQLPTVATIETVPSTAEARVQVLQELGYAFSDYDLWDGWLLLEESSAERIIRNYLIPWFAPKLARVKTVAAGGVTNVEPAFVDLHRLMLFTHLQPAYAGRAWVRVDGDESGTKITERLRAKFQTIAPGHFATFGQTQFERYYPKVFAQKIEDVLSIADQQNKREAKKNLLDEVVTWLDADPERAKEALSESAGEIIQDLKLIEQQLDAKTNS